VNVVRTRRKVLAAVAASTLLALTASCSDSSTDSSSPSSSDSGGDFSADGVPSIEQLTSEGSEGEPPSEGPPIKAGATVWWISCGQVVPDCSVPAEAAVAAGKAAGITVKISDGKLNAGGGFADAVRTAVASKPDAIILHAIACDVVKGPLQEAAAAGVKIMGVEALDCDDTDPNAEGFYDAEMKYAPGLEDTVSYFTAWGSITAQYLIDATGGKAQVILPHLREPLGTPLYDGFTSELADKCPDCKIVDEFDFTSPDISPDGPFAERLRAALLKNPDANAVWLPFDSTMTIGGGAQAIREAGRSIVTVGGSGQGPGIDLVRSGQVDAITGAHSPEWMGWAAIDNINRALQGEETVPQGIGFRVVDGNHNLPDEEGQIYQTPIDFKAAYEALWGN
jgi:ribose transport system substrate-binding protein